MLIFLKLVPNCAEYAVPGAVIRSLNVVIEAQGQIVLAHFKAHAADKGDVVHHLHFHFRFRAESRHTGAGCSLYIASGGNDAQLHLWPEVPARIALDGLAEDHAHWEGPGGLEVLIHLEDRTAALHAVFVCGQAEIAHSDVRNDVQHRSFPLVFGLGPRFPRVTGNVSLEVAHLHGSGQVLLQLVIVASEAHISGEAEIVIIPAAVQAQAFCRASSWNTSPSLVRNPSKSHFFRYFGIHIAWYLHTQVE